jgi:hypothetical protein
VTGKNTRKQFRFIFKDWQPICPYIHLTTRREATLLMYPSARKKIQQYFLKSIIKRGNLRRRKPEPIWTPCRKLSKSIPKSHVLVLQSKAPEGKKGKQRCNQLMSVSQRYVVIEG